MKVFLNITQNFLFLSRKNEKKILFGVATIDRIMVGE